jgi:hypothetical protein
MAEPEPNELLLELLLAASRLFFDTLPFLFVTGGVVVAVELLMDFRFDEVSELDDEDDADEDEEDEEEDEATLLFLPFVGCELLELVVAAAAAAAAAAASSELAKNAASNTCELLPPAAFIACFDCLSLSACSGICSFSFFTWTGSC